MIDLEHGHSPLRVVIIGGGITGLSTAWYLRQAAKREHQAIQCTVLERENEAGGKIWTDVVGSQGEYILEGGPDAFLAQKPWGVQLANELGLNDDLIPTQSVPTPTFLLVNGRPQPFPAGMSLIVPTQLRSFLQSPVMSPLGKARLLLDYLLPPRRTTTDESLGSFVRRRLGAEALDRLAEPLMAGIHNANVDEQSILATFPRFPELEQRYGSLIRGTIATKPKVTRGVSTFLSLRGGMQSLIHTLVAALGEQVRTGVVVSSITPAPDGTYTVTLANGEELIADRLVLSTPAYTTAAYVREWQPQLAHQLEGIRYVSTGTISLAFRRDEVGELPSGFGVIIPHSEHRPINAITITSQKFAYRAPADRVLVRVFLGGSRNPAVLHLPDKELLTLVRHELRSILDISATPTLSRIQRMWQSSPQYDVGHLDRVAIIDRLTPPNMSIIGSAYRGVGIPDCIKQAQETAESLVQSMKSQPLTTNVS